ncbi:MAG: cystathionine beta-lyase [marine bacterium B5-7]|nr:MAG: cystathionine beta-lyase [marine bacterium B5-7]
MSAKKIATRLAHLGNHPHEHQGVINPPVYHASTIAHKNLDDLKTRRKSGARAVTYGRDGTPTTFAFEDTVTDLEGGFGSITVSSGLAAIHLSLMSLLKPGDHILIADTVYAPVRNLCNNVLTPLNIICEFYDPTIGASIESLLRKNTRVVYMESPGSHTFEIIDVPAITNAVSDRDIVTVFDNTWATPLFFKPLSHGVDIVIHAVTKYLGGHSDLMMGVVVCNEQTFSQVRRYCSLIGQSVAPDDIYLAQRGIRTLKARLDVHQENALRLTDFLMEQPETIRVIHPALEDHPGHTIFKRDFSGSSGLFGVVIQPVDDIALAAMLDSLELFFMGFSWGGYESLIIPYDINQHRSVTPLKDNGVLLRIHAGLEDSGDLIDDLTSGFKRLRAARLT